MTDLPTGWAWTTLYDVAAWGSGGTPKRSIPGYYGGDVPWAVIGDLNDATVMETAESITAEGLLNSSAKLVPEGAVLLAMYGSIGKLGVAGRPMATNQAIAFAQPHPSALSNRYLLHYLRFQRQDLAFTGKGATQKNISQTVLRTWPLPLPPRAEQERIVAAIEEHLSRLDAAEVLMKAALARNEGLRKAAFRSAFPTADRVLSDVASIHAGATPRGVGGLPPKGDVPFYKVGDMNSAVGRWMAASRTYIENDSQAASRLRLWPAGTVIFPKQGGAIATNKKRQLREPAYCDLNTMGVIPGPELDPAFLYLALEQVDLAMLSDGTVIQQIKKPSVAGLLIGVPALDQQRQIAQRLEEWAEEIDRMQGVAGQAISRAASLRRSILAAAFSGKLVPQDPDDEPASVLLERIQAERDAATPAKRRRKAKAS